jgi:hypothetical protein
VDIPVCSKIREETSSKRWGAQLSVAAIIIVCLPPLLFAWSNPTHLMLGKTISRLDSLPTACYTSTFIRSNNAPDIFTVIGPEFAHSDYQFAAILLELAGDDLEKQAFAYGYFAHIAEDRVVHTDFLPAPGIEHAMKEVGMSSILYFDNPELQEAANNIFVVYDPHFIARASEEFVERYHQGRVISLEEIHEKADFLLFSIIAQQFLTCSPLVYSWANRAMPFGEWANYYESAIDSASSAVRNAAERKVGTLAPQFAEESPCTDPATLLSKLGETLCALGAVEVRRGLDRGVVTLTAEIPPVGTREQWLQSGLEALTSKNDVDGFYRILQNMAGLRNDGQTALVTLLSAYPNPFNNSTTISFFTENLVDKATVSVLNVLGQEVSVLYAGALGRGSHTLFWEGTTTDCQPVSSGVYFVVVHTSNLTLTEKVLLIK